MKEEPEQANDCTTATSVQAATDDDDDAERCDDDGAEKEARTLPTRDYSCVQPCPPTYAATTAIDICDRTPASTSSLQLLLILDSSYDDDLQLICMQTCTLVS